MSDDAYRLLVSDDRCTMVRIWPAASAEPEMVEVAIRDHPSETWGPPRLVREEK